MTELADINLKPLSSRAEGEGQNSRQLNLSIPYHLENFIGGNLIGPLSGKFIDNVNPATGSVFCLVPDSNEKDIDVAVKSAKKIFPQWIRSVCRVFVFLSYQAIHYLQ